jgi:hypothetical protein
MAVGLVAIAAILVVVLGQRGQRRSGTDMTPNGAFVAAIGAGQRTCQDSELLPGDTSAVRATISAGGKPTPALRIAFRSAGGRLLSSGKIAAGWRDGVVQIPISHVAHPRELVTVCLYNVGPSAVSIAGALPDPAYHMTVGPQTLEGRLRYDYMRPGKESWFELLPTIVYRSTLAKSDLFRHWAWIAFPLLMLVAIGLAARTIVREQQ